MILQWLDIGLIRCEAVEVKGTSPADDPHDIEDVRCEAVEEHEASPADDPHDIGLFHCKTVEVQEVSPAGSAQDVRSHELAEAGYLVDDQEGSTTVRALAVGPAAQGARLEALVATDASRVEDTLLRARSKSLGPVCESLESSDCTSDVAVMPSPLECPLHMDAQELAAAGSATTSASPLRASRENLCVLNSSDMGVVELLQSPTVASSAVFESLTPCFPNPPAVRVCDTNEDFSVFSPRAISVAGLCRTAEALMMNSAARIVSSEEKFMPSKASLFHSMSDAVFTRPIRKVSRLRPRKGSYSSTPD